MPNTKKKDDAEEAIKPVDTATAATPADQAAAVLGELTGDDGAPDAYDQAKNAADAAREIEDSNKEVNGLKARISQCEATILKISDLAANPDGGIHSGAGVTNANLLREIGTIARDCLDSFSGK